MLTLEEARFSNEPDKYAQFQQIFVEQAEALSQLMSIPEAERDSQTMASATREKLANLFAGDSDLLAQYDDFMTNTINPPVDTPDVVFIKEVYSRLADDPETRAAFQAPFEKIIAHRFASPIDPSTGSVATQEQWEQDWKDLGDPVRTALKGYPDLELAFDEWHKEKTAEIVEFGNKQ